MTNDELSADELDALDQLLPADQRTDDEITDLAEAARVAMKRRVDNSRHGGAVLAALNRRVSWRQIERITGIPETTARRWATPPPTVERPTEAPPAGAAAIPIKKQTARPGEPVKLVSTGEAAEAVGVTRAALTKWAKAGLITPAERIGRRGDARWNVEELRRQMQENKLAGRPK